jgi:hypothetical protein
VNTLFVLTIPAGSTVFTDNDSKAEFLRVFCEEYRLFTNSKYFIEDNIGKLWNQYLGSWENLSKEIIWDAFNFENCFSMISARYTDFIWTLDVLYGKDLLYRTSDGKSFNDYATELRDIRDDELRLWLARLNENIYIRNIDRFMDEHRFQIDTMVMSRDYHLEIVASYNELLTSFQQKDAPDGAIVLDAVATLTTARSHADAAADLQRRVTRMEYNTNMLEENEPTLRANSREAEAAMTAFIDGLKANQERLGVEIYEFYKQTNERTAEKSVIYSTPTATTPSATVIAVSTIRLLILFAGPTFVGVAFGFCIAFVKKYLPEKTSATALEMDS